MSVFYCHACNRHVDSDFENTEVIGDEEFCDDCAWNHKPDCPTCLGTGMGSMHASRCSNCGGSGLLKSEREKEDSEMASEAKRGGDY